MFTLRNTAIFVILSLPMCPAAFAQAATADWSGLHVGLVAGEAGLSTSITPDYTNGFGYDNGGNGYDDYGGKAHGTGGGAITGLDLGYNVQFGKAVLGVEGDYSVGSIGNSSPNTYIPVATNRMNSFATARLRAGYALDNTLLYATAGLAFAKISSSAVDYYLSDPYYNESSTGLRTGFVVGAGLEQALTSNISVKLEALYANLGHSTTVDEEGDAFKFSNNVTVGRVSLDYNF